MKNYFVLIALAVALVCPTSSLAKSKKNEVPEVLTCKVIHENGIYDTQVAHVQDSLTHVMGSGDGRFIGELISLTTDFISGKLISTASDAIKSAIDKSKEKFTGEWQVAAQKDYFYNNISTNGYMDLNGICFRGFRIVRAVPDETATKIDTAFYLSCRLDQSKLPEMVKNSTFELCLDSLVLDLSKTKAKLPKDRDFTLSLDIKILASWATKSATYFSDQQLGSFSVILPIKKEDIDMDRLYVCTDAPIEGRSFIIPRSYSGSVTEDLGEGRKRTYDIWGQGEYTIDVTVTEQTESKSKALDLLSEYLQKAVTTEGSLAGSMASGAVQQQINF